MTIDCESKSGIERYVVKVFFNVRNGRPATRIEWIAGGSLAVIEDAVTNAQMSRQTLRHKRRDVLRKKPEGSISGPVRKTRAYVGNVRERER